MLIVTLCVVCGNDNGCGFEDVDFLASMDDLSRRYASYPRVYSGN